MALEPNVKKYDSRGVERYFRKGQIGHVVKLANLLIKSSSYNEMIRSYLEKR